MARGAVWLQSASLSRSVTCRRHGPERGRYHVCPGCSARGEGNVLICQMGPSRFDILLLHPRQEARCPVGRPGSPWLVSSLFSTAVPDTTHTSAQDRVVVRAHLRSAQRMKMLTALSAMSSMQHTKPRRTGIVTRKLKMQHPLRTLCQAGGRTCSTPSVAMG